MTIREETLEKILDELKTARLKPPCGITITGLAIRIGVSRTVIKMHLIVLETKGLVESTRVQNALIYYITDELKER